MKKTFLILSALALLCLASCGTDNDSPTSTCVPSTVTERDSTQTETLSTTVLQTETTETTEPAKTTKTTELTVESSATTETHPSETTAEATKKAETKDAETERTKFQLNPKTKLFTSPFKKKQADFFDDVLFVGDSVTQGLKNYTVYQRNQGNACLGKAQFLCCGSLGFTNSLQAVSGKSVHPSYNGQKVKIEDGIQMSGAKKVFIMLGMNDFAAYSEQSCIKNINTVFDRIEEKNPHVEIYVESITPMLASNEHGRFQNENMRAFNENLQIICNERRYSYIDISGEVMAGEDGALIKEYCGDPGAQGLHMSNKGSAAWVKYLTETFCGT